MSSSDRIFSAISGVSFFTHTPYSSNSILWVFSGSKSSMFSNSSDILAPHPCLVLYFFQMNKVIQLFIGRK